MKKPTLFVQKLFCAKTRKHSTKFSPSTTASHLWLTHIPPDEIQDYYPPKNPDADQLDKIDGEMASAFKNIPSAVR